MTTNDQKPSMLSLDRNSRWWEEAAYTGSWGVALFLAMLSSWISPSPPRLALMGHCPWEKVQPCCSSCITSSERLTHGDKRRTKPPWAADAASWARPTLNNSIPNCMSRLICNTNSSASSLEMVLVMDLKGPSGPEILNIYWMTALLF